MIVGLRASGGTSIASADGSWSYVDRLGYDEAVTIARTYQYVTGPPESINVIKNDRAVWNAAHPGKESDYPGILTLPPDAQVLGSFKVPAGQFKGAVPCKSS